METETVNFFTIVTTELATILHKNLEIMSMQQFCTKIYFIIIIKSSLKINIMLPLFAPSSILPVDMLYFESFHCSFMMSVTILHVRMFRNSHPFSRVHKLNTKSSGIGIDLLSQEIVTKVCNITR